VIAANTRNRATTPPTIKPRVLAGETPELPEKSTARKTTKPTIKRIVVGTNAIKTVTHRNDCDSLKLTGRAISSAKRFCRNMTKKTVFQYARNHPSRLRYIHGISGSPPRICSKELPHSGQRLLTSPRKLYPHVWQKMSRSIAGCPRGGCTPQDSASTT